MILLSLYLACLFFSALTATRLSKHLESRQASVFIPFLWYVAIQELYSACGAIFDFLSVGQSAVIYNLYRPLATSFFVIFYYRLPVNVPVRRLIAWMYGVYLAVLVISFLFIQPITIYNSYLSLSSGFVITFCGIFFLFNYFNLDDTAEERKWLPVVWITIGITTFYPVVNISFSFYKLIVAYRAGIFGIPLYQFVPRIMSIIMYSCFSYAFYLCKKKN